MDHRSTSVLYFIGVLFAYYAQSVHASGYIQVGFGVYDFQRFPGQRPRSNSNSQTSEETTPSDTGAHHNVTGTWSLRTAVHGRGPQQTENSNPDGASPNSSSIQFPWLHETVCNETTSEGPLYRFLLCLDSYDAPSDSKPCQLARLETDALPLRRTPAFGSQTVSFSNFLGQTPSGVRSTNPAVFGFEEWPGGVKLRVFVTCCGVESEAEGRCQETLTFTARAPPLPGTPGQHSLPRTIPLTGSGRLILSILATCDPEYYGPTCTTHCRVDFPSVEHAFCNVTTGERQCLPGWEGVECQKDMDECRLNLCHNSATCTNDPPGSFTCHCPLGRGGPLCEYRQPVCHTSPCRNGGTCSDTNYGFICFCTPGYSGYRCETTVEVRNIPGTSVEVSQSGNETGADGSAFNGSLVKLGGLQEWHIALIVCAVVLFISITIIGCLLIRSRIQRYKFSKGTSFYSVCIKTKTFDNAMFDRDDNSDIICDDNGEEGGRRPHRQNSYTSYVDRYPTLAQARRSMLSEEDRHPNIVHPHRASGRSASSHVYDSCNPSAASSMRRKEGGGDRGDDGCQGYIDIINPYWTSSMSEVDVLHNQPQEMRAIRAVFTPRGTPRQSQKGQGRMKSSPALGRGLVIPQMIISQHVDPLPNGDSPRSARLAHADVYSIGGTLAPEDISGTPRSYDRRSFADAITSKGNPSEPKLRSIRRVDSDGYEVPRVVVRYPRPAMENEYTSLARRFTEEHIYDEVHRYVGDLDSDSDTQSLRELGVCTAVPPPRKLDPRRLEKSHADKKARKFSPRQDRKAPKSNEGSPRKFPFPKLGKALKGKGGGKGKEEKDGKKKKKEEEEEEEACGRDVQFVSMSPQGIAGSADVRREAGGRLGLPSDDGESSCRSDSGKGKSEVSYEELQEFSSDTDHEMWSDPDFPDSFWDSAAV